MKRSYSAVLIQAIRIAKLILANPGKFNAITLARERRVSVKTVRSYLRLIRVAYGIYPHYHRGWHTLTYFAPPAAVVALLDRSFENGR